MIRAEFLRHEEKKRFLLALGAALAFYCLLTIVVLLSGLVRAKSLADLPGTVWIDLDSSATTGGAAGRAASSAAPAAPPRVAPAVEVRPQPKSAPTRTAVTAPAPRAAGPATGATVSGTVAAGEATTAVKPSDSAGEPWTAGPRPQGSRVESTEAVTGGGQTAAQANQTVVSGTEQGNSLETVLGARSGKAGRSLYVPIYLYMPLPRVVDETVVGKIRPERREAFFRLYKPSGTSYTLSRETRIAERDDIWLALEEAGYDLAAADYKAGGSLRPVTLSFVVTQAPVGGKAQPRLEAVTVTSSSGNPQVDEAVAYGFGRAAFFNATDGTIGGTFTYRFTK